MRKTSIVVAIITLACGLVAAAQTHQEEYRTRTWERNQRGARETQAAGTLIKSEIPAAWDAVRKVRASGRPAILGITINDRDQGVAVLRVSPGGPADENGIETGDLIVAVDGVGLTESERRSPAETLIAQMGTVNLGDTLTLTVRRGDDDRDIEIVARAVGPYSYFVL